MSSFLAQVWYLPFYSFLRLDRSEKGGCEYRYCGNTMSHRLSSQLFWRNYRRFYRNSGVMR